ncbi:MAG: hypothetical protein BWY88_00275 [Synergistetes bacterium ADurb.Bin520]|nr:MAG: hypothetical protein BWY88_00275 [Synergistetes bacterium ADurb.Bin520]
MIGGLVQDEEVRVLQQKLQKSQARLFPAGQHGDGLVDVVSGEQKSPQEVSLGQVVMPGTQTLDLLPYGVLVIQVSRALLGEKGPLYVKSQADVPFLGGLFSAQKAAKGRLARAVDPYQGHPVPSFQHEVQIAEDLFPPVGHAQILSRQDGAPAPGAGRKMELHRFVVALQADLLEALQALDPALDLGRLAGLVPKPFDEFLSLFDFRSLEFHLFNQLFPALFPFGEIPSVVPSVECYGAPAQLRRLRSHLVQKPSVVGYGDEASIIVFEVSFQPLHALRVQVVRGLVQEEDGGAGQENRRQGDAHLPTPGKDRAGSLGGVGAKTKSPEHFFCLGFEGVAILQEKKGGHILVH